MSRPKVSRLYGTKIIFKCRNCGVEFNFYEHKEKYCHNCGRRQAWNKITFDTVTQQALRKYQSMSVSDQKAYLESLDLQEPDRGGLKIW